MNMCILNIKFVYINSVKNLKTIALVYQWFVTDSVLRKRGDYLPQPPPTLIPAPS